MKDSLLLDITRNKQDNERHIKKHINNDVIIFFNGVTVTSAVE